MANIRRGTGFCRFYARPSGLRIGADRVIKTKKPLQRAGEGEWEAAMQLQESGEMYLETIYLLSRRMSGVRAIDVGEHMGYSKPSVSRAMGLLRAGGYITVDEGGFITLTDAGREIGEKIYERHTLLTAFLVRLGVDAEIAAEDACRLEHAISDTSFEAIKRHAESMK